jgi:hypothetical protein
MMAKSSAQLGLNENDESNDLQLLGEKPRQFLYSEGIYSGNDLLRISTGDLGINYKKWREKNGLKELKSPGGGSSISGWKNIIRTAKGIKKGSVSAKLIPLPRRVQLSCTTGAKTVVKQEIPTQVTPQLVSFEEQQQDFFDEEIPKMAVVSSFVSAESNDKAPSKGEQVDVGEQAANMTTQGQTTHDDMSRFRATLLHPMDSTKELCDVRAQCDSRGSIKPDHTHSKSKLQTRVLMNELEQEKGMLDIVLSLYSVSKFIKDFKNFI